MKNCKNYVPNIEFKDLENFEICLNCNRKHLCYCDEYLRDNYELKELPKRISDLIEAIEEDYAMKDFFEILNRDGWTHDDYCYVIESVKESNTDSNGLVALNEDYKEMMKVISDRSGILI